MGTVKGSGLRSVVPNPERRCVLSGAYAPEAHKIDSNRPE